MKFLIGAVAVAIGVLIFCLIRASRLAAGAMGAAMILGTLTLWSLGRAMQSRVDPQWLWMGRRVFDRVQRPGLL